MLARLGGRVRSASLVAAVLLAITAAPGLPRPARAQVSPLCERNGRPDYCAWTPEEEPSDGERETVWVVFADHTRVRLVRDELHCSNHGDDRLCRASMTVIPSRDGPLPATYRGRCIQGGYRHEYRSRALHLAYVFLSPAGG